MNLKTLPVVMFIAGVVLMYSAVKNVWPHVVVMEALGKKFDPQDRWIDPDRAVKGFARPLDPIPGSPADKNVPDDFGPGAKLPPAGKGGLAGLGLSYEQLPFLGRTNGSTLL